MPRRTKAEDARTVRQRQKEFLGAYVETFSVTRAAELVKVDRICHYRWMKSHPKYAAAFRKCQETVGEYLETEAIQRAGEGWDEPVFYQGSECGQVRRFDSGLMQFLLRGLMPEKYGAKTEISGPEGGPLQAKIEVVFVRPDNDAGNGGDAS